MTSRLRTFAAALGLAVPLVAALPPAGADPFTAHFDGLRAAMQTRFDALPLESPVFQARERRAIGVALQAMARTSVSVASDVKLFAAVAQRVEAPTAASPEIQAALAATADGLGTEVDAARASFALSINDVLQPTLRTKLDRTLERVDVELLEADFADTVAGRAKAMLRAQRRMSSAAGLLARANACRLGRGYAASRADGTVVEAKRCGALVSFDTQETLTNVLVLGYDGADDPVTYRIEWATGMFTGTGLYEVTPTSGLYVSMDLGGGPVDAVQCLVLVTDFDPATRRIAGRFDGRLADGTLFSSGRFRVCGYGTETLE
jgi:hypothetical protein